MGGTYWKKQFEYSRKVIDSKGIILGEDNFRADLLFQPLKQNTVLGMGDITFKVVNISPTYCDFYEE